MWCATCQQDVPLVTGGSVGSRQCPRCKRVFTVKTAEPWHVDCGSPLDCGVELDVAAVSRQPPVDLGDWEVTDRLRRIERLLAKQVAADASAHGNRPSHLRVDIPQVRHSVTHRRKADQTTGGSPAVGSSPALGLWAALMFVLAGSLTWLLGAAADAGVPTVAAFANAGLAIPLQTAGICLLLAGTFSAVAQGVSASRRVARRLDSLETVADDLLATSHRVGMSASSAFYANLAHGASPRLLLADIKGQVDQLSVRTVGKA